MKEIVTKEYPLRFIIFMVVISDLVVVFVGIVILGKHLMYLLIVLLAVAIDVPVVMFFVRKSKSIARMNEKAMELYESIVVSKDKIILPRPMEVEHGILSIIYDHAREFAVFRRVEFEPINRLGIMREIPLPSDVDFYVCFSRPDTAVIRLPAIRILDKDYYISDKCYIMLVVVPPMRFVPQKGIITVEYKEDRAECEWYLDDIYLYCRLSYQPSSLSPSSRRAKIELMTPDSWTRKRIKIQIGSSSHPYARKEFRKQLLPDIDEPIVVVMNRGFMSTPYWSYLDMKSIIEKLRLGTQEKNNIFGVGDMALRLTLNIPFRPDKHSEIVLRPKVAIGRPA